MEAEGDGCNGDSKKCVKVGGIIKLTSMHWKA